MSSPSRNVGVGPSRSKSKTELAVLVACHSFMVAVPARFVTRLLLLDEAGPLVAAQGEGTPFLGTVTAGDQVCAAWDLGRLLELESLEQAWVILVAERGGARVPIALRTGVCALVADVRADTSLPGRIFRSRAQAFPAAFGAASVDARLPALFGLWLDPGHLFTDEELLLSRDAIAGARPESVDR